MALDLTLGYILLTFPFPTKDTLEKFASECFDQARVRYAESYPDLPLNLDLRKYFCLPIYSMRLTFAHSLQTSPVIRSSGEGMLHLSCHLRNLTSRQLIEQVSCHRGKLRDHARNVVDTYRDIAVKNTPPDVFRSERGGHTVTMAEEDHKIICRFVREMLADLSFLNNHMAKPSEVSIVMLCYYPYLTHTF